MKGIVEAAVNDALWHLLRRESPVARKIIGKAIDARARRSRPQSEKISSGEKRSDGGSLSGKLAAVPKRSGVERDCSLSREIPPVDQPNRGRDRKFQAILPLKGKIPKCGKSAVRQDAEQRRNRTLILALGTGIGRKKKIPTRRTRTRSTSRGRGTTRSC